MAGISMEVVMSDDLQRRLVEAAKAQGTTLREFIQEALYSYVEDIEDGVMSHVALEEEGLTYLLPEGVTPVALEHSVYEAS